MAQQVFEYKGKFDVSDIVSSLKTLRAELGKSVTSESGGKMLSGIDKQFEKIAQDVIKMQSSLEKGFSSTSEVKAFEKELNKMYDSLLQIKNNMANVANTEIKINIKGAKKEFEDLEKEIKKIKDQALKDLLKIIDESVAKDKVLLKSRAKTGELTKESLQSEIDKREENIKKEQEEIQVLKDKYKQEKENKALEDALRQANSRNITTKTKLEEHFSLIPRRGSTDPRMRAQGLREGTYSQSEFNDSAAKEINRLYKESLKEAYQSSQDVTGAIDIFKNKLSEFGVELKVTKDLQSAFSFALEAMATKYDEGIKKVDNLTEAERNSIKTHSKKIEAFEEENNSLNDIISGLNNYESEIANANARLANFSSTADKNNDALEQTASNLNNATPSIQNWGDAAYEAAGNIGQTISQQEKLEQSFDHIKSAAIQLLSIGNIYNIVRNEITKTYEDIKSLDQAFGQIAMVTDFTLQDMWSKYDKYAQIANEMGQTTLSVVQASGLYFQQGLDEADALELTASTMKLATLAGLDFEQATSLMTSAVRGFHMEMSEGEHVTDVYSELAANAAASVNDIATAMSRTAAIANSAGMEFETTSAMLTTMIEATQESPETLGTAMKTVIARFTELKKNVSATESEFEDLDYNKVDTALKSIGVALKDVNGQFRDIDDVFLEVADKWDTLDRNTQRYIATTAAGSRQQSRFIALMENSARVHELLETAQDSAGRSSEQFAKYADTLENKVNRLKNSWEQFKLSILDSEFITTGVDLLNNFVSKMSKMNKGALLTIGSLGTILAKRLIGDMSTALKTQSGQLNKAWKATLANATNDKNKALKTYYTEYLEETKEINTALEEQKIKEERIGQAIQDSKNRIEQQEEEQKQFTKLLEESINTDRKFVPEYIKKREQLEENIKEERELIKEKKEELSYEQQITAELTEQNQKMQKKAPKINKKLDKVNKKGEVDENSEEVAAKSAMISLMGSAISSALLIGITTFMTSKDATSALKTAALSLAATIVPVAAEAIITGILKKIAGSAFVTSLTTTLAPVITAAAPILIGLAVVAAIGAGIAFFNWYNSEEQKLKREGMKLKEELEKAQKNASAREEKFNKADEEYKSLDKLYNRYNDLNSLVYKTTEQQEEYQSILEEIKNEYPDLVSTVNNETGELAIQNDLLEEKLKKLREEQQLQAKKLYFASNELTVAQTNKDLNDIDKEDNKISESIDDMRTRQEQLKLNEVNPDEANIMLGWEDEKFDINTISRILGDDYSYNATDIEQRREDFLELARAKLQEIVDEDDQLTTDIEVANDKLIENQSKRNEIIKDAANERKENYENYAKNLTDNDEDVIKYLDSLYKPLDIKAQARQERMSKDEFNKMFDYNHKDIYATDLNQMGKRIKEAIKAGLGGISDKDLRELISGEVDVDALWDAYKDGLIELITQEFGEDNYNELTEGMKENLHNFMGELGNKTTEELNKINTASLSLGNVNLQKFMDDQITATNEEIALILKDKGENNISIADIFKIDADSFSQFSQEGAEALRTAIDNLISNGLDPNNLKQYGNALADLFSQYGLKNKDTALLLNTVDFSKATASTWEQFKKDSIKKIQELNLPGLGGSAAEQFFEGWAEQAEKSNVFSKGFKNTAELTTYTDSLQTASHVLAENQDAFEKFFSTQRAHLVGTQEDLTNLESALEKFEKAGMHTEDLTGYYSFNKKGEIVFDTKKIQDLYKSYYDLDEATDEKYNAALKRKADLEKRKKEIERSIKTTTSSDAKTGYQKTLDNINTELEGYKNINEEYKKSKKEIQDIVHAHESWIEKVGKIDYSTAVDEVSNLTSLYKDMRGEMDDNGFISSKSVSALGTSLTNMKEWLKDAGLTGKITFKKLDDVLYDTKDGVKLNQKAIKEYIDTAIKELEKLLEAKENQSAENLQLLWQLRAMKEEWEDVQKESDKTSKEKIKSAYEDYQDALDKVKEKQEALAEAEEEVIEKEEELIEKQEELQKLYYGEENHKNQNDYLYNYNTELEQLEQNAKKAKEALDNLKPGDDVHQKVQDYVAALRDEVTNYKAQNEVIEQYIENQKRMLDEGLSQRLEQLKAEGAVDTSTNVSDFYYEKNGRFYIDYSKLNAAKLPDDVRDWFESQVEMINKYSKVREDNLDKIEEKQKEFLDWQKAARDKQIAAENKVIELLKKKDQEELDNLKEKYDGMKAADDDYTSALEESIKKQRDLRNQASQWDDLAEKEKKLSLQQRDTSGANAKEIQKTQEDIAKTRESLLDDAVDNIINNLKELYEEQEETRQAEIEYRQAILDNKDYNEAALDILSMDKDDFIAWMQTVNEDFNKGSEATKAKMIDDWTEIWLGSQEYSEAMSMTWEDASNQTSEEIDEKVRETSETLTTESERALDETMDKVHEAQEKGREEVEAAEKAVEDAKNKVVEATRAVAEALEEARKKQEAYNEAIAAQGTSGGNNGNTMPGYTDGDNGSSKYPSSWNDLPADESWKNTLNEGTNWESLRAILKKELENNGVVGSAVLEKFAGVKTDAHMRSFTDWLAGLGYHGVVDIANKAIHFNIGRIEDLPPEQRGGKYQFASGGLVDYTGPAWVDGTPSKPEAFLSASDTEMIREFIDLQKLTFTRPSTDSFTRTNNYGDPVFNIDINVDSISSDYDVDRLVERVHEDILSITSAPGQSVILSK